MKFNKLGFFLAGSILLGGCSSSNDPEEIQQAVLQVTPDEIASTVSLRLQDETGAGVAGVIVSVDDRDLGLIDDASAELTTNEFGFVSIVLADGVSSGSLLVTVDDPGFVEVAQEVILGEEADVEELLTLTALPEAGETAAIVEVNDEGETEEVISLATEQPFVEEVVEVVDDEGIAVSVQGSVSRIEETTADEGEESTVVAEILVPELVELKTEDGEPSVGEITVTAAVYQNSSDVALDAFPGGLEAGDSLENESEAPEVIVSDDAQESDTTGFISAGFVSLEVTDSEGKDITQFDGSTGVDIDGDGVEEQGLLLTSLVSKETINPNTNELVAIGDSIPVWSYDEETAKWTYDGEANVFEEADSDNLRARFAVTHLSYWSLAFRVPYCFGINVVVFRTPDGAVDRRQLSVNTRLDAGYSRTTRVNGDGFLLSIRSPRENVKMTVYDRASGEDIDILTVNGNEYSPEVGYNFCPTDFELLKNVVLEAAPVTVDVNVQVETSCRDESLDEFQAPQAVANSTVYLLDEAGQSVVSSSQSDTDGLLTFSGLDENTAYNIFASDSVTFGPPVVIPFTPGTASDPLVVDFEQECVVTTGSVGGN
ncbi:carboxypeptidase-like regulatory domain-containing protein [Leucothrix arctica]|uniref:Uncharacterized protein n=1 Tax=Leucothrix arctica TaxID=1481894 RepID=A0A317CMP3_9GAMM|nr:carboxypeptidase-like regulatory domain-containing protein [Leucothrix arctica]PWQ98723.1 hypothetical protein DKT75_02630 [Leucothrix arctica]